MEKNFNKNESFQAAQINRFLESFGFVERKKPKFRLVWSEFERELRTGEFEVWAGPLFIRTEVCTREMPKYPYLRERYILEMYVPPESAFNRELPNSKYGDYYPIYVFESCKGDRLPLNMRVVEIIMHSKFNTRETEKDRMCRMQAEFDLKEKEYEEYVMDSVESSDIISNLHFGEAIIVPKNYDITSPNLKGKENENN